MGRSGCGKLEEPDLLNGGVLHLRHNWATLVQEQPPGLDDTVSLQGVQGLCVCITRFPNYPREGENLEFHVMAPYVKILAKDYTLFARNRGQTTQVCTSHTGRLCL